MEVSYREGGGGRRLLEVGLVLRGRRLQLAGTGLRLVLDSLHVGVVEGRSRCRFVLFECPEGRVGALVVVQLHLFARLLLVGVPVAFKLVLDLLHRILLYGIKRNGSRA